MTKVFLQKKLERITDERRPSYVGHKLEDVLIIVMSSILCGLDHVLLLRSITSKCSPTKSYMEISSV